MVFIVKTPYKTPREMPEMSYLVFSRGPNVVSKKWLFFRVFLDFLVPKPLPNPMDGEFPTKPGF